jgi:hypothetical protein
MIMAADRGGRRHRKLDNMRGNDFGGGFVGRDILGQFQMHRARPLLLRDPEGVANQRRDRRRGDDLRCHLGQGPHGGYDVDDLEARLTAGPDRLLSRQHHHRHGAEMRIGRGRGQVERAGTERRQADPGAPREPAVSGSHEACRLLVPGQHQLYLRAPQRLQYVEILLARNGEDVLDALVLERGDQKVGALAHAAETPRAPGSAFSARCGSVQFGRTK